MDQWSRKFFKNFPLHWYWSMDGSSQPNTPPLAESPETGNGTLTSLFFTSPFLSRMTEQFEAVCVSETDTEEEEHQKAHLQESHRDNTSVSQTHSGIAGASRPSTTARSRAGHAEGTSNHGHRPARRAGAADDHSKTQAGFGRATLPGRRSTSTSSSSSTTSTSSTASSTLASGRPAAAATAAPSV